MCCSSVYALVNRAPQHSCSSKSRVLQMYIYTTYICFYQYTNNFIQKVANALQVAEKCMWRAKDLSGLLLLYSAKGSAEGMQKLVDLSKDQGKQNVAFLGLFLLGQLDECVDLLVSTGRTPEAAFFARTYVPSRVSEVRAEFCAEIYSPFVQESNLGAGI